MPNNNWFVPNFVTPEKFEQTTIKDLSGPDGWLLFAACNSGIDFALDVKNEYELMLRFNKSSCKSIPLIGDHENPITRIFADTESCPRLKRHVAGSNVYVFQCVHERTSDQTVNENIQQLLQVVRTLSYHRAKTITVVTPYSPYSRQDKPSFMQRESTLASLFADQLNIAGADFHLTYHPHSYSLYGLYEPDMKMVALNGLDLFIEVFEEYKGDEDTVVISTDSGGAKFTIHYANAMKLPYAIASKFRYAKDSTQFLGVIGDIEGKKRAIITDDETVSGSSLFNLVKSLYLNYGIHEIYVAISHMKLLKSKIPDLIDAHKNYGLKTFHITDTIPQYKELIDLDFVVHHKLARRFAATINHMHYHRSISEMFYC